MLTMPFTRYLLGKYSSFCSSKDQFFLNFIVHLCVYMYELQQNVLKYLFYNYNKLHFNVLSTNV